ncbi:hypothetical protein [uncultured Williamsia sp.]|uniref:DUF6992 family protein n=1 Tax=uncultured Williamsia sp. TaxID=259311 RepID=UPI002605BD0B|nr:hypothetical protein [uncultured Williamsia sp.]
MTVDPAPEVSRRLARRLAIWGGASTLAGGALAVFGSTARARAFGQQNAAWGAIDLVIAAVATRQSTPPTTSKLRRLLWVNTGLDVGYVAGGAWFAQNTPDLGGRVTPEQARGHGAAVIVQGAALFVLDLTHARALSDRQR